MAELQTKLPMIDRSATYVPDIRQSLLWCLLPLIAFALAAFPIAGWLVDDALISFAYARSFADGAGLVTQPGKVPVEGFSNFLWTLLFVPGFWLDSNVPLWTAKVLGHVFSFGVFFCGFQIVVRITRSPLFACLAMIFLALNTAFVVWSVSGLENALYGFEIIALAYLCLVSFERPSGRIALAAGLLAAAAALTRPDGIIFVLLWPWAVLVQTVRAGRMPPEIARTSAAYLAAAALPVIAYKGMALAYFGYLFPNTYYAKGGPSLDTVLGILLLAKPLVVKGFVLLAAPFGFAWLTLALVLVAFALSLFAKRSVAPLVFLVGATALAMVTFILLPSDWMPEFRFGTPFLVLFYPTLFSLLWAASGALRKSRFFSQEFPALLIISATALSSILVHKFRFERFYNEPTAPFAVISDLYGERFNRAEEILGVERASFLLPDLGGTLFSSKLEIYDLAGLTDATIARTLRKDNASLHEYIFNEVKPTFILTYAYSTLAADLDNSSQFRQQYTPLRETVDAIATEVSGRTTYSGAYVRKDVVAGRPEALAHAREILYGSP